jgi:hypothetical protein
MLTVVTEASGADDDVRLYTLCRAALGGCIR